MHSIECFLTQWKGRGHLVAAAILITILMVVLQWPCLNGMPAFVHAWSQSDWYAIAVGFTQNGFDFFHPESMIYNKQFSGWWAVDYATTITSVDFPIHEYLVALLMTLFGTTDPWVFRCWTLLCSLVGVFFLYRLSYSQTHDFCKSLLVVAFAITAPVYTYYSASFLPCAPAFASASVGLWAYVSYLDGDRNHKNHVRRYYNIAFAALGLAMLIRTTFVIAFIAVAAFELLRIFRRETSFRYRWVAPLVAFLLFVAYWLWNKHLREAYGSLFLGELKPAKSLDDVREVWLNVKSRWLYEYFQRIQYRLYFLIVIAALVCAIVRWRKSIRRAKDGSDPASVRRPLSLWWLAAIYLLGACLFCAAMLMQFIDHDYYFYDTFYLPLFLILILALAQLPQISKPIPLVVALVAVVLLAGTMMNGTRHQRKVRCPADDYSYQQTLVYAGADKFLDDAGVPRDARILSLFSYPQNMPLVQMRRKGYSIMWHDEPIVDGVYHFKYDYIVIDHQAVRDNWESHNDIMTRLLRIDGNEHLSLCLLADTVVNKTPEEFFSPSSAKRQ